MSGEQGESGRELRHLFRSGALLIVPRRGFMDQTIFHLINEQWTRPALDLFMAAISNVDIWKPFIVVSLLIPLIFGGFKGRALLFCAGVALLVNSSLTNELKRFVDRRRPKQAERVRMVELAKARPEFLTLFKPVKIRYSDETDRQKSGPSFPSGHVTNNITVAIVIAPFSAALGLALFPGRGGDRLLSNLSRGALAQRCARDSFSRRRGNIRRSRAARVALGIIRQTLVGGFLPRAIRG